MCILSVMVVSGAVSYITASPFVVTLTKGYGRYEGVLSRMPFSRCTRGVQDFLSMPSTVKQAATFAFPAPQSTFDSVHK
jgi:hypothetical protein